VENNILELIEGFKAPAISFYYLLTHLNYRIVGEMLFAACAIASLYLFAHGWVYFCIRLDNKKKKEKENKWTSKI
jgi:hypothetical protein